MSKSLLFGLPIALAIAIAANAQAVDANPNANTNDVFLDNHRPLLPKKEKPPTARTVTGKVVDDTGQPVDGALVTITNEKTHERRQFITKQDGRYSFREVSFTIDYELAAQYKGLSSDTRKLSQYDHAPRVVRILQIGSSPTSPSTEAKKEPPPQTGK